MREGCYKEGAKSKTYSVTIKSDTHAEQEAFQNTEAFYQLAANRYKVEAKNSEFKKRTRVRYGIDCGSIWHGNSRCYNDIRCQFETDIKATKRKMNKK
ncbi:hypothetical protein ACQKNC_18755 [Lysinibacillus sp. NPDC094177]|uniref:hypothetical protein n=1 Tax=Lysinibacillus sp. NPDC094177 TaxID=3390580 RepID=UPI003CFC9BA7